MLGEVMHLHRCMLSLNVFKTNSLPEQFSARHSLSYLTWVSECSFLHMDIVINV